MKKQIIFGMLLFFAALAAQAQKPVKPSSAPKLVVGIMVDQMRWDYLYRFQARYGNNGFKRILREGFTSENAYISYAQTVTAAGHASVYTGSVPAINGIMGNEWYSRSLKRDVYCAEDSTVQILGGNGKGQPMSPKNLLTTTVTDELKMATNFRSKVIGVAMKDRGSILPAGHRPDGAYWYESASGNFVTSTWYMQELTPWATAFNQRRVTDSLYKLNWNLSYPFDTYVQSDLSHPNYASNPFPRKLEGNVGKNQGAIASTPWGNTLTLEFSKAAIEAEQMGADSIPDFLAISLSSPDYIGHAFGPNSVEVEDNYLKLDRELAAFFDYLDKKVGKGQYLFFMTADHAVSHSPGFNAKYQLPGKAMKSNKRAENATMQKFGLSKLVEASANYQVYLDRNAIEKAGADFNAVKSFFIQELNKEEDVLMAFDNANISAANIPAEYKEMFLKGYNHKLAGDVQVVYNSGYFYTSNPTGSTHGSMYPYDSHIPLLWMGWGIKQGASHRKVYMSDIAATVSALLKIQMPSGNVGSVIEEVIK
jgi:predicted AlkP superfamily pyrophosphatase or phosphodiesterase